MALAQTRKPMTIGEGLSAAAFVLLALLSIVVGGMPGRRNMPSMPICLPRPALRRCSSSSIPISSAPLTLPPLTIDGRPNYNMEPVKFATIAAVFWGIAGFTVGLWAALELAFPVLNFDLPGFPSAASARCTPRPSSSPSAATC